MDPLDGSYIKSNINRRGGDAKTARQTAASQQQQQNNLMLPPPAQGHLPTDSSLNKTNNVVNRTALLVANPNSSDAKAINQRQTSTPFGLYGSGGNSLPKFLISPNESASASTSAAANHQYQPNGNNSFNTNRLISSKVISTNSIPALDNKENSNIISYQRVVKNITVNDVADAEIKLKEEYVSKIKNTNLNIYSFPNENKPRTDYTYAHTSSYRSKEMADDSCDIMPNLCRRGRRSPANSANNTHIDSSTALLNESRVSFLNLDALKTNVNSAYDFLSGIFSKRPSVFDIQQQQQQQQPDHQNLNVTNPKMPIPILTMTSSTGSKVNRRLDDELNDDETNRPKTRSRSKGSINKPTTSMNAKGEGTASHLTVNDYSGGGDSFLSLAGLKRRFSRTSTTSTTSTTTSNSANGRTSLTATSSRSVATMTTVDGNQSEPILNGNRRSGFRCCRSSFWPFLLLLLILLPLGYLLWSQPDNEARRLIVAKTSEELIEDYAKPAWSHAKQYSLTLKDNITPLLTSITSFAYYSGHVALNKANDIGHIVSNALESVSSFLTRAPTQQQQTTVNYIPPVDQYDRRSDERNKEFTRDLNQLKEKILQETLSNFKELNHPDIDLVRKELDQKFNYTLAIMSNKLADQSTKLEVTQNRYESELKQMREVLNEFGTRYSNLFSQMQLREQQLQEDFEKRQAELKQATAAAEAKAQEARNEAMEAKAAAAKATESNSVQSKLQATFSDENISFEKIEEFINRTIYLYNADKTGMTDFASESIGGSILFTRCTETYKENSRWFTLFDVPITRITVSPRVVIQGSIQPGNCWAFKGSKADLFIKLAASIRPKSFSLEHIPKEISITGKIDSAPQNFTIYGYTSKEEISDDKRLLLGNFRYDNESKNTLQFFSAQHEYNLPISVIELKIESNAGNKEYTCLYKFRVHGELFRKNENIIADRQQLNSNNDPSGQLNNNNNNNNEQISGEDSREKSAAAAAAAATASGNNK